MRLPWGCSHPSLTGHARGLLTSLLTLLLLRLGSAQLRVEGPGQPLTATVGQDVVLPCHLSPQRNAHSLEVRWIRDEFSEIVHHYRNGEDLYGEQMGAYAGRTELLRDGLSAGIKPQPRALPPATGADLHLSLGGYEDGGVRVLCRSAGWYPLPQMLWRDAHRQHLPSVSQTHSQDQEGLFDIEGAIIVTGSMEGPLSCVVRSSHLQQERESSLHISAPFFHNAQPLIVALALVLVLLAVSIGLACPGLSSAPDGLALSVPAVKVTLDPDTAHPRLVLSEDNRRVRFQSEQQQLPSSLDRFDSWCCVLGREEFEEGRHCWLVEVEGKMEKYSWWGVGVARASVTRTGFYKMTPEEGIWAVRYQQGQLKSLTLPRTPLSLSSIPTRIWVCLDCTQQQVSFVNADNGVEIFKFPAANFDTKPIRPWFLVWTEGFQLCLRESTPHTTSTAQGSSCDSPATPASPLLGPAGAAQE
uniref:Butyrophilin subfamily 1 member A1 n=1 Tax=Anas platyrhynchos TaxID=8839 RepID=A0A8B9SWT5_ANAPL